MGEGGKKDEAARESVPEPSRETGAPPASRASDTDSVYDDFLQQVAHAPSVDPGLLRDMVQRGEEESLAGRQLAHFKVVERLGEGGMGVVYRAEDQRLRRMVALKVLSVPLHDEQRNQWLLGEARSAAAVSHPNIAAIYEVGEAQGLAFIAMEYVEGQSLRTLLAQGQLPAEQALALGVQIAQGLARAHQSGIVHRDLKPDNVMVGSNGFVKILDFGLAVPLAALQEGRQGEGPLRPGQVVGTVAYMSPEQARGRGVDARSDVYSFGVLVFELLAGRRPRPGLAREEAQALALDGVPEGLAGDLRRALVRCLEPLPEERYPDGAALVEALVEMRQGASAGGSAGRLPPGSRPLGHRRRRWLLLALALLVLGGGAFVAFGPELRPERPPVVYERRLTANPPENLLVDAALSPDGRTLAYTDQSGLYLRELEPKRTEALHLPGDQPPQSLDWLPNGDELLVTSNEADTDSKRLWRLRLSTHEAHSLGVGRYVDIRVSPEGGRLAWIERGAIRVGPLDLSNSRVVATPSEDGRLSRPCWSPDGKRLAYVRVGQTTASLETISLETGKREVVQQTPRLVNALGESALAWSASGELVFALCDLPPKEVGFAFWRVAVDPGTGQARGRPRLIHGWSGFYPDLLSVSPKGSLAFARFEAQADVYVGDLSDGGRRLSQPRRLTPSERDDLPTSWSPDGKALLFTSDRDGTTDIFLQTLDEKPPRKLGDARDFKTWAAFTPAGDGILFWRFPWPPDERPHPAELMAMPYPEGKPSVHVLNSEVASGWTWFQSRPGEEHFRCVSKGGTCVLGEQKGGQLVFSALDPRSGRGRELGRVELSGVYPHAWDLSPDGQRVALPGPIGEVRVVDLSSGKNLRFPVYPDCWLLAVAWSADGRALFATGNCKTGQLLSKVFRIELDGTATVLWQKPSVWLNRPMASPDGQHLALGVRPIDNDIWLVTGF